MRAVVALLLTSALPFATFAQDTAPADPCREDNLVALQTRFGYLDAAGEPSVNFFIACRRLPDAPRTAALAIHHLARPFAPGDDVDGEYDLHLLVIDADARVLAEGRDRNAAYSDAERLDEAGIDTGRYHLAPGVRAFGVFTSNSVRCYQCVYAHTDMALYVREGRTLRKVLDDLAVRTTVADDIDQGSLACTQPFQTTVRTLARGKGRHGGYADLVVTTVTTHEPGYNLEEDADCGTAAPEERHVETWTYDGAMYRAPAALPVGGA